MILDFLICSLISILIGYIIGRWTALRDNKCGILFIDTSDSEKDIYSLEFDDLDELPKKKYVTLKVYDLIKFKGRKH